MTFTTESPTTPGFYAWKLFDREIANPCWVTTDGESYWRDGKYPATNGYWCRLVPAEEVKEAFEEGWELRSGVTGGLPKIPWMESNYELSRAKQVAEGKI